MLVHGAHSLFAGENDDDGDKISAYASKLMFAFSVYATSY